MQETRTEEIETIKAVSSTEEFTTTTTTIINNNQEEANEDEMSFLDDVEFSAKNENQRLNAEIKSAESHRRHGYMNQHEDCYILPKIEKIEKSLESAHEQIRSHFLVLERLKYNFETHTKQIKVLESFIESQNTKNEKIHHEIASLKITVEAIQTETGIILQTIERVNQNFERHIDDMEAYFLKSTAEENRKAKEKKEETEIELDHYLKGMKIGLWFAYSLGAIVVILGAIHAIFAPESLANSISGLIGKIMSGAP